MNLCTVDWLYASCKCTFGSGRRRAAIASGRGKVSLADWHHPGARVLPGITGLGADTLALAHFDGTPTAVRGLTDRSVE